MPDTSTTSRTPGGSSSPAARRLCAVLWRVRCRRVSRCRRRWANNGGGVCVGWGVGGSGASGGVHGRASVRAATLFKKVACHGVRRQQHNRFGILSRTVHGCQDRPTTLRNSHTHCCRAWVRHAQRSLRMSRTWRGPWGDPGEQGLAGSGWPNRYAEPPWCSVPFPRPPCPEPSVAEVCRAPCDCACGCAGPPGGSTLGAAQ